MLHQDGHLERSSMSQTGLGWVHVHARRECLKHDRTSVWVFILLSVSTQKLRNL
jgi:hypothetical protein